MVLPVLPESAPFTPSQRAWLNGFFAGVLSLDEASSSNTGVVSTAQLPAIANGQTAVAEPAEEFPWHDATLPIAERLQLAEGQPLERVLMAAMAQLDCGSCGYMCQTYAEAIASGTEKSLTKCVPGGKETAKKLKEIMLLKAAA